MLEGRRSEVASTSADGGHRGIDWGAVGAIVLRSQWRQVMAFARLPRVDATYYREMDRQYGETQRELGEAGLPVPNLIAAMLLWLMGLAIGSTLTPHRRWLVWLLVAATVGWMGRAFFVLPTDQPPLAEEPPAETPQF
jgi:hypothetical protein